MRGCWLVLARTQSSLSLPTAHQHPPPPLPSPPPPPLFPYAAVVRRGAGVCGAAARGGRQRRRRRPQEGRQEAQGQEERAARQRGAVRRGRVLGWGGLVAAARRARVRAGEVGAGLRRACARSLVRVRHTRDDAAMRRACAELWCAGSPPRPSGVCLLVAGGWGGGCGWGPAGSRFKLSHGGDREGFLSTTPSVRASESTPTLRSREVGEGASALCDARCAPRARPPRS